MYPSKITFEYLPLVLIILFIFVIKECVLNTNKRLRKYIQNLYNIL